MQGKAKLVKWGPSIFALLIVWLTTFAGELLVTRASVGLGLKMGQSCQLVKNGEANTRLIVDSSIPDSVEDLLNGDNGTQKYGLQCKKSQETPLSVNLLSVTPCIETSVTTCVVVGATSSVLVPSASPMLSESASPTPSGSASPTPSESASPPPSGSASPPSSGSASPPPSGSASPPSSGSASPPSSGSASPPSSGSSSANPGLVGVSCMPKNNQEVCTITAPSGTFSSSTSNGTVTCTFQNNRIECKGTGVVSIIKSILGMTLPLPPNGAISCALQNMQIVCTGGASSPNSLISCTIQDGQADCKAAIPSNVSVGLPSNKTLTCVKQGSQIVCTTSAQASSSNSAKVAADQLASNRQPFCQLIKGTNGNTQLTFASNIPSNIKDPLKGNASLNCKNI